MLKSIINYLVSELQVDRETATTVVLTLVTFITGYFITAIVYAWSKWRKKVNYRRTLKSIIRDFLKACRKQGDAFADFEKQEGFLKGSNLEMGVVSNFAQKFLISLDVRDFIDNFSNIFYKGRSKEISEFLGIVENVNSATIYLKQTSDMVFESYNQKLAKYNENLSAMNRLKDSFIMHLQQGVPAPTRDYMNSVGNVFKDWLDQGGITHLENTHEKIVRPLLEGSKTPFPTQFTHSIQTYALEATAAYKDIATAERMLRDQVKINAELFRTSAGKGESLIKKW